ncbi:pogo transposable element with ZNF domain [Arapaima gigas]
MADSGLLMECEEEDLEPWQKVNDDVEEEEMGAEVNKLNSGEDSFVPPADASVAVPAYVLPLSSDGKNVTVSILPGGTVPTMSSASLSLSSLASSPVRPVACAGVTKLGAGQPLILTQTPTVLGQTTISQLLQTLQVASNPTVSVSSAAGQPYMVAVQDAIPAPRPIRPPCLDLQNVGVNVKPAQNQLGILLNGQPVTLVPGTQIIRPLASSGQVQAQPNNTIKAVQIPAAITIRSSSPLAQPTVISAKTGQSTSPALSQIAPKSKIDINKGNLVIMTNDNSAVQKVVNLLSYQPAMVQPQVQKVVRTDSGAMASDSKAGPAMVRPDRKKCSRCGAQFKMVEALRGQICLCSPELRKSLQAMESTRNAVKSPPASVSSRSPQTRSPLFKIPLSVKSSTQSPQAEEEGSSSIQECHGKLIMLVDDFYYGSDPGHSIEEGTTLPLMAVHLKCIVCDKKLKNNVRLINHLKSHMEPEQQSGEVDTHTICQHCYRHFPTPFLLQCHLENVHSQYESTTKCKICEWAFESEPIFLQHMKNSHRPGEMPYVCQVCEYRSSFYAHVYDHFCNVHQDTGYLLCPYCLRVFKTTSYFQHHFFRHRKKTLYHCDKCRLQFISAKERIEHKSLHHKTFRKPRQLEGLKPGTKVTIRAYAVQGKDVPWPSISAVPNPLPKTALNTPTNQKHGKQTTTKRSANSMVELMTKFQEQRRTQDRQICLECKFDISSFPSHYPTYVSCSRCHYRTCCSRAYANHMISNHVPRKTTTKYLALYKEDVRSADLICARCGFTTQVGDLMAKHLVTTPGHCYSLCTLLGGLSQTKEAALTPVLRNIASNSSSQQNLTGKHMQATVDILSPTLLPKHVTHPSKEHPSSTQLPPKPVAAYAHDSSVLSKGEVAGETAVTENMSLDDSQEEQGRGDELLGPVDSVSDEAKEHESHQVGESKVLMMRQMRIMLLALCAGISQAADYFSTESELITAWLVAKKNKMAKSGWSSFSSEAEAQLMEWVLIQREQQLPVNDQNLLLKATEIHTKWKEDIGSSCRRLVEFLLKHDLGANFTCAVERRPLRSTEWKLRSYVKSVHRIIKFQKLSLSGIGCMDELSVFVKPGLLEQSARSGKEAAFQLVGTGTPLFDVVLAMLADGSMLPAMVFFRGKIPEKLRVQLPQSVLVESNGQGFSDDLMLQLWLSSVWQKHVDGSDGARAMLIVDSYRGHKGGGFVTFLEHVKTLPAIVPQGCAGHLLPLEMCIGPVVRDFLQECWRQLVAQGGAAGLEPTDLLRHLVTWLAEAMTSLGEVPVVVRNSFQLAAVFPKANFKDSLGELQKRMVHMFQKALKCSKSPRQGWSSSEKVEAEVSQEEQSDTREEQGSKTSEHLAGPAQRHTALRQVFEKDSDAESFLGFEDSEMMVT